MAGKGILNHGGCLKSNPCYIGLAKALKALLHFRQISHTDKDCELNAIIDEATVFVRQQEFCYRRSTGEPISKHILKPAFPASYVLNIVELLEIAALSDSLQTPSAQKMLTHISSIQNENGTWGVGYLYKSDGYLSFDGNKKNAEWITASIRNSLQSQFIGHNA